MADWPLFHCNSQQTGYTEDDGPSEGKLAWKFPIGYAWYSRPVVEKDRIYAVSPGIRTVFYCLDEKGNIVWKTRQAPARPYSTPRLSSSPLLSKDRIFVREVRGSFIICINKFNGNIMKKIQAGYLDYRVTPTILAGNEEVIIFPFGTKELTGPTPFPPPPVFPSEDLVCKEIATGETIWSFHSGQIFCEPTLEEKNVYIGTIDGLLYCLNIEGSERIAWQFKAEGSINSSPIVWNGNVYFGANDGVIYCLNKENGKVKWRYEVEEKEPRAFIFFSTPTIAEGRLYIGAANKQLYCLDAETGKLVWKYMASDWIRSRPACQGDKVYVASIDGTIHCLKQKNGEAQLEWKTKVGTHPIFSDLTLSKENLFITSSDLYLYCINTKNGKVRWRRSLLEDSYEMVVRYRGAKRERLAGGEDYQSSPVIAEGKVFIGGPSHFVYAIDAESGKEIWRFEVGGQIAGGPVYSNSRIFVGQKGGTEYFYCLDAKTGNLIWKQKVGWVWSTANVSDGRVFVPSNDGYAYCLREEDGAILWRYKAGRDLYSSPPVSDGIVYFGSWDGCLYALNVKNGSLIWKFHLPHGVFDSGAPVVYNGMIILPSIGGCYFVDARTGKIIWRFKSPYPHMNFNSTSAVHDGRVFLSGQAPTTTRIFCVDIEKRTIIWEHPGGGLTGPAIANGRVYFGSHTDPFFYCVDEKGNGDGTTTCLWKYEMGDVVIESCTAISGGKAFILCSDGYLYAFK